MSNYAFELSICIINHRTPDLLKSCLLSAIQATGDISLEILVVNNTYHDKDNLQSLLAEFPNTQFIQNEQPLGFAANQNQMLCRARGRYWLPLNSDTEIKSNALHTLINFMDTHPRVGIAGPRLIYPDGSLQPSARDFPTPFSHFLEASGLWRLLRNTPWAGRWHTLSSPHTDVRRVDWLTGACLIVRPEAARLTGLYNDNLFPALYGEDLEWCWRMRTANWEVAFVPQASIIHHESQSPVTNRTLEMYRGFYRFCAHYYSRRQQIGIRIATILALIPRWLVAKDNQMRSLYANLIRLPMSTI